MSYTRTTTPFPFLAAIGESALTYAKAPAKPTDEKQLTQSLASSIVTEKQMQALSAPERERFCSFFDWLAAKIHVQRELTKRSYRSLHSPS